MDRSLNARWSDYDSLKHSIVTTYMGDPTYIGPAIRTVISNKSYDLLAIMRATKYIENLCTVDNEADWLQLRDDMSFLYPYCQSEIRQTLNAIFNCTRIRTLHGGHIPTELVTAHILCLVISLAIVAPSKTDEEIASTLLRGISNTAVAKCCDTPELRNHYT